MKKGVTLKDIAKRLNMSISTVSKALNNDASISTPTKERVHKKAREWNYIPNESARHFKLNKSFTIGIVIPDLMDQFYTLAINGVEKIAAKENYNIILTQSHENTQKEERIIDVMIKNRIDGIIIAITKNTTEMTSYQKLKSVGIPVVCIAREPPNNTIHYVCTNNTEGAFKATDLLIKKGHRRVGHLMGPENLHASQERLEGYKKALLKNKIPIDEALIKQVDFSYAATAKAIRELLKCAKPPTGIFTFKNYITLDAIDYLKTACPHCLAKIDFAGFGNLPLIKYLDHKPLVSIEESSAEMGAESAKLLFDMINEKISNHKKIEIP
jgi:LacI family transcriptional regulator